MRCDTRERAETRETARRSGAARRCRRRAPSRPGSRARRGAVPVGSLVRSGRRSRVGAVRAARAREETRERESLLLRRACWPRPGVCRRARRTRPAPSRRPSRRTAPVEHRRAGPRACVIFGSSLWAISTRGPPRWCWCGAPCRGPCRPAPSRATTERHARTRAPPPAQARLAARALRAAGIGRHSAPPLRRAIA